MFMPRTILAIAGKGRDGRFSRLAQSRPGRMPLERIRSNGYAFQVEMAYIAYRLGYKIREIPFTFIDRQWGTSKMSFQIQREAAVRVWRLLYEYRNLKARS
jgi:dolichol-phosphate mannosyltransferase